MGVKAIADRVKETTVTTGTGTLTLAGAVSGYRAFQDAFAVGTQVYYAIELGTEWEVGIGTLATASTLTRVKILASSNSGSAVSFSSGTKQVWCNMPARALKEIPLIVIKQLDEAVSNNTTLHNDAELFFSFDAGDILVVEYNLNIDDPGSGSISSTGFKTALQIVMSGGSPNQFRFQANWYPSTVSTPSFVAVKDMQGTLFVNSGGQTATATLLGAGTFANAKIQGVIDNTSGPAGVCNLQWSQATSDTSQTKVRFGSWVKVTKVNTF